MPVAEWLPRYRLRWLLPDWLSALAVWAVLVPQSLAYATIAGVPPQYGLFVAIAAPIAYMVFGTSSQMNVGPSSAVAITSAASVGPLAAGDPTLFLHLTTLLAVLTGTILFFAGIARLGFLADFFARPVLTGFVFGLATVIVIGQLPKFLGVEPTSGGTEEQLWGVIKSLGDTDGTTLIVGLGALAAMLVMRWISPRIPAALLTVAGATIAVKYLDLEAHGVAILGDIPATLPTIEFPGFEVGKLGLLVGPAIGVALLAYAESMGAARQLAIDTDDEVDANQELIALGFANMGSGVFQGFACDASLSRSSVADLSGQKTQLAGGMVSVFVIVTVLALTPLFHDLPDAALAAVITAAVLPLFDFKRFGVLRRQDRMDYSLAVVSAAAVILLGVLFGIATAVVASLLAFVYRGYRPNSAVLGIAPHEPGGYDETFVFRNIARHPEYLTFPGVLIFRYDHDLFFANARGFSEEVRKLVAEAEVPVKTIIFDASAMTRVDTTAGDMLRELMGDLERQGIDFKIARAQHTLKSSLRRTEVDELLGEHYLYDSVWDAVEASVPPGTAPRRPAPGTTEI